MLYHMYTCVHIQVSMCLGRDKAILVTAAFHCPDEPCDESFLFLYINIIQIFMHVHVCVYIYIHMYIPCNIIIAVCIHMACLFSNLTHQGNFFVTQAH